MAASLRAAALCVLAGGASAARSWVVANDAFMRDGQPFIARSGSLHYHRLHPALWADRIARLRSMGLNTIQTYVPWNHHSQARGVYDFASPSRDLVAFIKAVAAADMVLLFRAGPYICGEHDFGGLPSYLLATPGIASADDLRTNNTAYMAAVDEWWRELLPLVAPYTYANGGPIVQVAVENEYGSYGDTGSNAGDKAYMLHLRDLATSLLPAGTQLYTVDGNDDGYLSHGALPGILFATGDGGGPPFAADHFNPPGWRAHINSELYPGWLTHWGEGMANHTAMSAVGDVSRLLAVNASFNLYMGYGGTNFGWNGGANGGGSSYQPVITSYDYNAPLAEGGGHGYGHDDGDKYDALRRIIGYWADTEPAPPPEAPAPAVAAYPPVALASSAALLSNAAVLGPNASSGWAAPPSFEALGLPYGYVLYTAPLPTGIPPRGSMYVLTINGVADRAEVFLRGASQGVVYRPAAKPLTLDAASVVAGETLSVLVENHGHLNYGRGWWDPKGFASLSINGVAVAGAWTARPMSFDFSSTIAPLPWAPGAPAAPGPAFFRGTLSVSGTPADTYVTLCGWGKGQIFVNGEHLGRHWASEGPQHAYYLPAPLLRTGDNDIVVFEQHAPPVGNVSVGFSAVPDFTGAVCGLVTRSKGVHLEGGSAVAAAVAAPVAAAAASAPLAAVPHTRAASRPHRAASAAAVSAPRTGTCPAPAAGVDLTLQPCNSGATPLSASTWTWVPVGSSDAGVLSLTAAPGLCASVHGKNADTGEPNIALGPCDVGDRSQHYLPFPHNGNPLLNPVSGNCLDAEGGQAGAGAHIETYGCDGGGNQEWSLAPVTGGVQLVGAGSGLCVAAC